MAALSSELSPIYVAKFFNHVLAETPTPQSSDVEAVGFGWVTGNDEVGRNILKADRSDPHQRVPSNATELMDQGKSAQDSVIADIYMSCQARAVGKNDVITQSTVMSNMAVRHQKIMVTHSGNARSPG